MPEIGMGINTEQILDNAVTEPKIKDNEIINADINSAAAIAYSKLATDPRICRIKTGTYTGDGGASQAITGVGFRPKFVMAAVHTTVSGTDCTPFIVTDVMGALLALYPSTGLEYSDRFNSLDLDGFTVGGTQLNDGGRVYDYIAFG